MVGVCVCCTREMLQMSTPIGQRPLWKQRSQGPGKAVEQSKLTFTLVVLVWPH